MEHIKFAVVAAKCLGGVEGNCGWWGLLGRRLKVTVGLVVIDVVMSCMGIVIILSVIVIGRVLVWFFVWFDPDWCARLVSWAVSLLLLRAAAVLPSSLSLLVIVCWSFLALELWGSATPINAEVRAEMTVSQLACLYSISLHMAARLTGCHMSRWLLLALSACS